MIMRCNDSQCIETISQTFYICLHLRFQKKFSLIYISKYDSGLRNECGAMFIIFLMFLIMSDALMKCPLLHGNIQKETDRETEKSML